MRVFQNSIQSCPGKSPTSRPRPHSLVRELLPPLVLLSFCSFFRQILYIHVLFPATLFTWCRRAQAFPVWTQVCRFIPVWTAAPSLPVSDPVPEGQHLGERRAVNCPAGRARVFSARARVNLGRCAQALPSSLPYGGICQVKAPSAERHGWLPPSRPLECVRQQTLVLLTESVKWFLAQCNLHFSTWLRDLCFIFSELFLSFWLWWSFWYLEVLYIVRELGFFCDELQCFFFFFQFGKNPVANLKNKTKHLEIVKSIIWLSLLQAFKGCLCLTFFLSTF